MTDDKAIKMLKAFVECQKRQTKGIYERCNSELCVGCPLCYEQGTVGQRIEAVETGIKALEKWQMLKGD